MGPAIGKAMQQGRSPVQNAIESLDWGRTPLGSRRTWPNSLATVTSLVLNSPFPMFLLWGEGRTLIYNDSYVPILGDRHPSALGRPFFEVWPEVRESVGPVIEDAFLGNGSYFENLPVELHRSGRPDRAWFTFSYSPIIADGGEVGGALCVCLETTAAILESERQAFLGQLRDRLRVLDDSASIIQEAQRALGTHLGASRVGYGSLDETERFFTTSNNWTDGTVPNHNGTHDLAVFGQPVLQAIRAGESVVVEDVEASELASAEDLHAFHALEIQAAVTVSLVKGGRAVAALYVHQGRPRRWSDSDLAIIREVAEITWAALGQWLAREETGRTARLLQAIGDASPDLIYAKDRGFRTIYANAATLRTLGLPPENVFGRAASEYATLEEEGHQHAENDAQVLASGDVHISDEVFTSPDGVRRVFRSSKAPLRDVHGAIVGIAGVSVDVTERRALEDDLRQKEHHLRLLVAELNHRVKNTLSVVQSIAHQSLSKAGPSPEVAAFEGRLRALADAHNLLTSKNWEGATMREVVTQALTAFTSGRDHRFTLTGPHVSLHPQAAVNLTLAVNELATNASKYGSLSTEEGSVAVEWSVDGHGQLQIQWQERGGPLVKEPRKRGFGTRMIERVLSAELGGTAELSFRPQGLLCTVRAPTSLASALKLSDG